MQNVYNNQDHNFQERIVKQLQKPFGRHEATSLLKQREEEGAGALVGETGLEQVRRSASHLGDESAQGGKSFENLHVRAHGGHASTYRQSK